MGEIWRKPEALNSSEIFFQPEKFHFCDQFLFIFIKTKKLNAAEQILKTTRFFFAGTQCPIVFFQPKLIFVRKVDFGVKS